MRVLKQKGEHTASLLDTSTSFIDVGHVLLSAHRSSDARSRAHNRSDFWGRNISLRAPVLHATNTLRTKWKRALLRAAVLQGICHMSERNAPILRVDIKSHPYTIDYSVPHRKGEMF